VETNDEKEQRTYEQLMQRQEQLAKDLEALRVKLESQKEHAKPMQAMVARLETKERLWRGEDGFDG
jgi:uncharacterized protein HemX